MPQIKVTKLYRVDLGSYKFQMTKYHRTWLFSIALLSFSIILSLGFLEIVVRNFFPQQLVRGYVHYDPQLGSYHKPNASYQDLYGANYLVRTNEFAFRMNEAVDFSPDRKRVIAYGDSFTFGWGLEYEKSYIYLLKTYIEKKLRHLQILNGGVGGYSTGHAKILLERHLKKIKPSAIIYFFNNNDLLDNIITDPNYRVTSYRIDDGGRVYLKDKKPFELWKQWALAYTPYGWLNQNSHLFVFAKAIYKEQIGIGAKNRVDRTPRLTKENQTKVSGVVQIEPQFTVRPSQSRYLVNNQSTIISVTSAHLNRLAEITTQAKIPLIVFWIPSHEEMFPHKLNIELRNLFHNARQQIKLLESRFKLVQFIDTTELISESEQWFQNEGKLRLSDGHFNSAGNRWYAKLTQVKLHEFLGRYLTKN